MKHESFTTVHNNGYYSFNTQLNTCFIPTIAGTEEMVSKSETDSLHPRLQPLLYR